MPAQKTLRICVTSVTVNHETVKEFDVMTGVSRYTDHPSLIQLAIAPNLTPPA